MVCGLFIIIILGAEGLLCVLGDKIDKELLEAAGKNNRYVDYLNEHVK